MRTLVVVGTRPEVIKLAPVVHQLERAGAGEPILVATGQHRELVHQMLRVFGLAADIDLDVMTHRPAAGRPDRRAHPAARLGGR